jgi:hypothetical protein
MQGWRSYRFHVVQADGKVSPVSSVIGFGLSEASARVDATAGLFKGESVGDLIELMQ